MLEGITITIYEQEQTGTDEFNRPIYEETADEINNVLVSPASEQEITDALTLYGRRIVYTLAIPKGDTHEWTGKKISFFDREFLVVGDVIQGIDNLIPLSWNKKIRVEAVNK